MTFKDFQSQVSLRLRVGYGARLGATPSYTRDVKRLPTLWYVHFLVDGRAHSVPFQYELPAGDQEHMFLQWLDTLLSIERSNFRPLAGVVGA